MISNNHHWVRYTFSDHISFRNEICTETLKAVNYGGLRTII